MTAAAASSPIGGAGTADDNREADDRDDDRDRPLEHDHAPMQLDPAGDHRRESE